MAQNTENWLKEKGITVLNHSSRSPDLNPAVNLFGTLASKVYDESRQYNNINELKQAILHAWSEIEKKAIKPSKFNAEMDN